MRYFHHRRIVCFFLVIFLLLLNLLPRNNTVKAKNETAYTARPSVNGRLHVDGKNLVDENGTPVQLRGLSTHGLTWYPDIINEDLFAQISDKWNVGFIRLAMYSEEYCSGEKDDSLRLMKKGISAAIAADMYVLVDWHILNDYNPNINKEQAREFFEIISSEYSDYPNLIFEICNEPNGDTEWEDIVEYSNEIIPVIRKNIPDSVIIVGTPNYDRDLLPAINRPIEFDNIMYTLHFYAASHYQDLMDELRNAVDSGLPVFITECGISEASGDGIIDFRSAKKWFNYLNENSISYAVWSLSDKSETSAILKYDRNYDNSISNNELTVAGKWVMELVKGSSPDSINTPADIVELTSSEKRFAITTNSLGKRAYDSLKQYSMMANFSALFIIVILILRFLNRKINKKDNLTYYDLFNKSEIGEISRTRGYYYFILKGLIILSAYFTLIYLCWRTLFSIPYQYGIIPVIANILLLIVEIVGFIESILLFSNLLGLKNHPLPEIEDDEYPDVDIFIATYNEPTELLRKTINGCNHLRYPDKSKVHVYVCDDNRRKEMRELAESMGVGYFDRPDNKGAKAGNLNNALSKTSSPYIVTLDADMIVKSNFLLKTIPYFVDAKKRNERRNEEKEIKLGLLQTPQCFYDPDVFQHALYSERRAPNEQDFFYRTIEVSKTSTNSVIYGGSNTILSREALEAIGGFYTESITEDFATGLLIEAAGFVSLALPEPLASGQTPHTYKEHIQQRSRWGRGVIVTAKKLKIWRNRNLSLAQKLSYISAVIYWYSPLKNFIYIISPLLFATFAIPVLHCNWLELLLFWLPMHLLQDASLRVISGNAISTKWSGIYETSVMPHLLFPILKESLGISLKTFKVTDKSKKVQKRQRNIKEMLPFIILVVLSVIGLVRIIIIFDKTQTIGLAILAFWIIRNLYYLIMALFLIDGRDYDGEVVNVIYPEFVDVDIAHGEGKGKKFSGVTTLLTEHHIEAFFDGNERIPVGKAVNIHIDTGHYAAELKGAVTGMRISKNGDKCTHSMEILDFGDSELEYLEILYDRVPSLPQSLVKDYGLLEHLWQNIAYRIARTTKR
ncbi:cellulase family glycosylhydrolase [Butyrivibrio sp. LC3010]|uniref:cellulase family glycosylhydrolase n=1 Tax=Butyrivibrio sp. LC3010 TaxID=1280680 RepID=UPI0009DC2FE3|nr:cellulase family glycosylhydrolase [Butyrivibrio sp. LC3010]